MNSPIAPLPCPFCGDHYPAPRIGKRRARGLGPDRYHWFVKHGWCGSEGAHGLTEQQAIENWNRRPNPETQANPTAYWLSPEKKGGELVVLASHYSKPSEYPDAMEHWLKDGWEPLYRSPVESVPVATLSELEAEFRAVQQVKGKENPAGVGYIAGIKWCADRLSAIVKEYSK